VVLALFSSGAGYIVRADFQDAGGLVPGDAVLIGPAQVGTVKSIALTSSGQAEVVLGVDASAAPLHVGTMARVYQNSLSGIANRYVTLQLGPGDAPKIASGGVITEDHTTSSVNLDQVFDSLDPLTRQGLRGLIRGEAASIQGRASAANRTLQYLAPGLASTTAVANELARDEPAFDGLVVQGAQAFASLASRRQQLSDLISNASVTTAAIARQGAALQQALAGLPRTLTTGANTFAGLNTTLDSLDPVVQRSKLEDRRLAPFASSLRSLTNTAIPTLAALNGLIHNPSGAGDLTTLAQSTPALERISAVTFPRLVQAMNSSQPQLDYLREFTPDVAAAIGDIGQAGSYYDANGHYVRTQPDFFAFGLNAVNQLVANPPFGRLSGLQSATARCPGGAVQPTPDGSAPFAVPGCNPSSTPPGP
jgi:phospholipid/cholesterol/gamma-HCH transport system substrate-binding protein